MFTGLIEELGEIAAVADGADGRRFRIRAARIGPALAPGASVAVNGVCLTVAALARPAAFEATAVGETLRRTTLGALPPGRRVNLERPLRIGDRLDGHWVNGHVDGTGRILEIRRRRHDLRFQIGLPAGLERFVAEKGSIAVDGVSLTIGEADLRSFSVFIIPETRKRTLFGTYREGDEVNIEADILAKYAARARRPDAAAAGGADDGGPGALPPAWGPRAREVFEAWQRGDG